MQEVVKKKINLENKYKFPENLKIVNYCEKIIIIAVDIGNWIVLENEQQLSFFFLLKEYTIKESFQKYTGTKDDAISVLIQIEDKKFDNLKTIKKSNNRIYIYLTNACNLLCPHCYMYAGKKNQNELNKNEIISFLRKFKLIGGEQVVFTGGEICTREDLIEIIDEVYELGYKIELLTNGTLWNYDLIKYVAPKIEIVQVSIDGYNEESNSKIRGVGNFEKSLKSIEMFLKEKVKVRVAITPYFDESLENNIDKYVLFINSLLEKFGENKFDIHLAGNLIAGRELKINEEINLNYSMIIKEIYEKSNLKTRNINFIERHKRFELNDNCSIGNIYVSSCGDVFPCSRISEVSSIGNVRSKDFNILLDLLNNIRNRLNVNNLLPCCNCELKYICGGGCRLQLIKGKRKSMQCTPQKKNSFYDLMIKYNKKMFQ